MSGILRGGLHLVATLVVVPYLALACAFLLLGQAIARKSLLGFLDAVLWDALFIVPWGAIAAIGGVAIIGVLGMFHDTRGFGAIALCLVSVISLAVLVIVPEAPIGSGELTFLAPCAIVSALSAWLAYAEWR